MELKFFTCKDAKNCNLIITDATGTWLQENDDPVTGYFRRSDVVIIDVVIQYDPDDVKVLDTIIVPYGQSAYVRLNSDGWYFVYHVVIPTRVWFSNAGDHLFQYDTVYYYDEDTGKYYKYRDYSTQETTLEEILEINPINTTINKICQNYFSLCELNACYIKLIEQLLDINGKCKNLDLQQMYFNRDLIWSTLNVIKYAVDVGDYEGAALRLKRMNRCNGLCKDSIDKIKSSGCGCSN